MKRWLKIIGAMLMLSCFALPMSSCTEHRDAKGQLVWERADGTYPQGVHEVNVRHYLFQRVNSNDPFSWLHVVAIIWPAIFVSYASYKPASCLNRILWLSEPLLLAGTFFMLFMGALFEKFEIGTYFGWIGVTSYFLGWLMEAVNKSKIWLKQRREINQATGSA